MKEFRTIVKRSEGWFVAYSPEVPGANGQGRTKEEAIKSLGEAIELILKEKGEDRRERRRQGRAGVRRR
jgi:predicted RNase H-like HicB family nuclease